jgi:hypothetical protein
VHGSIAEALDGSAACRAGASLRCGGVQVIRQGRRQQRVRGYKRAPHVADDVATPPGTPPQLRLRGGDELAASVGRARLSVCAHHPTRCVSARQDDGENPDRAVLAADRRWRPLDSVQAQTVRGLVAVCVQAWTADEGWDTRAKPPGAEGSRRRVLLRRRVDPWLFVPPAPHAQLRHHLPASPVGRLRAQVQVEGLVTVLAALVASVDPPAQWPRLNEAWHEVLAYARANTPLVQRHVGRLDPTPSVQDRASEVMRNMPALST